MNALFKPVFLILAIIIVAAAAQAADKKLPSTCKQCSMRVDPANKIFSVTISEGIEPSTFDDIGCAMLWRDGECAMRTSAFDSNARVYDYATGESAVIEQAFFVRNAGIKTPMGYGIAAFKKKEAAEKSVKEKGQGDVLTFSQLTSLKLK